MRDKGQGARDKMLTLALLALACVLPVAAQVEVVCAPSPLRYSRSIFDHRTARNVQHWGCVATNTAAAPASVSEASLQGWMMRQGVSALSTQAIRIGAPEIERRGKFATAGRVLSYAGLITAALAAGDVIQIGTAWGSVAGFSALQLPQVGQMLTRREPASAIFEQLAMPAGEIQIDAGKSVALSMFAAPLEGAKPVQGVLMMAPPATVSGLADEGVAIEGVGAQGLWARVLFDPCEAGDSIEPRACAQALWERARLDRQSEGLLALGR